MASSEEPARGVHLVPIALSRPVVEDLAARLSRHVAVPCRVVPKPPLDPPRLKDREQVDGDALLGLLEAGAEAPGEVLVGLTAWDISIPIFTFVFGRARQNGRAALVSVARLDPVFYGLPPDPERLAARAVSEIRHELGHVGSLAHCRDAACLMSFAGSVEKVDVRGSAFCAACAAKLPRWLRGSQPFETV